LYDPEAPGEWQEVVEDGGTQEEEHAEEKSVGARARSALASIEGDLPPTLKEFSRDMRRGLTKLEKQMDTAQRDARRRWTRTLRDASHQLGKLEAAGEKQWRRQTTRARREAAQALRRIEKAVQPAPTRKKTTRRRKKA
jgi:hypothetical protein